MRKIVGLIFQLVGGILVLVACANLLTMLKSGSRETIRYIEQITGIMLALVAAYFFLKSGTRLKRRSTKALETEEHLLDEDL